MIKWSGVYLILLFILPFWACAQSHPDISKSNTFKEMEKAAAKAETGKKQDTATFAAGCFWCVEEQFKQLQGVISVTSGYTGGTVPYPTYKLVCTGTTGHAEACNIIYDPSKISYDELLAAFFIAHNPTTLNRQGNDEGTQYRSAIYYHNETQHKLADYYIKRLDQEKAYSDPIVTEVAPYGKFYNAEDYHQNYYENNASVPYCQFVVKPKRDKFREVFKGKLKQE
ncbi:peptide-methionine (S)-S-oxide reductase MsrA [Chitinophaga rhizophila]|nr:peptide-methionine (S)-S-oxide reductase MsrA [Chitinophaga rhizophila]